MIHNNITGKEVDIVTENRIFRGVVDHHDQEKRVVHLKTPFFTQTAYKDQPNTVFQVERSNNETWSIPEALIQDLYTYEDEEEDDEDFDDDDEDLDEDDQFDEEYSDTIFT